MCVLGVWTIGMFHNFETIFVQVTSAQVLYNKSGNLKYVSFNKNDC